MAHPTHNELKLLVEERTPDTATREKLAAHVESCEFCREYCENYRNLLNADADLRSEPLSPTAAESATALFAAARRGLAIPLSTLAEAPTKSVYQLAADSESATPPVENLATYFSEDPEFVLRLMRDHARERDYLQLAGEAAASSAEVLLRIPDLGREFVTNREGRVDLKLGELEETAELNWEIKLPDASFSLSPLQYDPEHTESVSEVSLESESGDSIRVTLEQKTEGKQIVLQVLALDGRSDFKPVRLAISQAMTTELHDAGPSDSIRFELSDPEQEIRIRLFQ
jgi:hypothetical protein